MIVLVIIASVLIAVTTIYQYREQTEDYHNKRLERKEKAINLAISYELNRENTQALEAKLLYENFDKKLNEISDIHNLDISIYNLKGDRIRSSNIKYLEGTTVTNLSKKILNKMVNTTSNSVVLSKKFKNGEDYKFSLTYLLDVKLNPIGILGVPYLQDNTFQKEELKEFLIRLSLVYVLILMIGIIISYFLSKYITKSLEYVSEKMSVTTLDKTNKKIILESASEEIHNLVNSYNNMIDQMEESAVKLAQIERKSAWREMAKQVAHEIKNPLTPMRLTVQSFAYKFDPTDPNIKQKLHEYSESLIQQIDTMSSIASAFSDFAQMPSHKKEALNIVEEVKKAVDIFHESYINFYPEKEVVIVKLDKTQLTRVVTNLITNAIHALNNRKNPKINVKTFENKTQVFLEVKDNGIGILEEDVSKIFEPKFTTKSSGMGLGLSMVKNIIEAYNGTITFQSEVNKGTTFTVMLPKK